MSASAPQTRYAVVRSPAAAAAPGCAVATKGGLTRGLDVTVERFFFTVGARAHLGLGELLALCRFDRRTTARAQDQRGREHHAPGRAGFHARQPIRVRRFLGGGARVRPIEFSMTASPSNTPALLVVIDGPAGAGKTTVARRVSEALSLPLLDTGAIYRTLALLAERRGVAWGDEPGLAALAEGLPISFVAVPGGAQIVRLGDEDVSVAIRTPEMSHGASTVSALPAVRRALLGIQRALGAAGCVAEGRDMGTVVFPTAPHKFFLTADLVARAKRRRDEMVAAQPSKSGGTAAGVPSVQSVADDIATRDARDSSRTTAPLVKAADAVEVDTTQMDADAVVALVLSRVRG